MNIKKTGSLFCGILWFSGSLFAANPNMNIDGVVANDLQQVLTMGAESKAEAYKNEEAGLDLLQQNQNAWGGGNSFQLPTSSDPLQQGSPGTQPVGNSTVSGGSVDRPATGLGSTSVAVEGSDDNGNGDNVTGDKGNFDAASQEKIKQLEADVAKNLKDVQDMEREADNNSNLAAFRTRLQALSTALDTLEKVKQMDPEAVSVDVQASWSSVDAMCSTTKVNVSHSCKQINRGADEDFLNTLVLQGGKDDDEKDDDEKDDDEEDDNGDTEEPESAIAAVRAACGGAFGGNNGSPTLMAKLRSGACAEALKDNPDISAKAGVDQVLGALQKWRNFAHGPRKNLLMLSGIGIERLYEIGVVIYPGQNQEDVMGLNPSPAVAVQQEHITAAQIATPEALAAAEAGENSVSNVKTDKPMTSVSSFTD